MTLAKAIAGGLPLGVMMASEKVSGILQRGDHASTFGGGPVVCGAALAVIDVIKQEKLVERSYKLGEYLRSELRSLNPIEIRGLGLMVGVELEEDAPSIVTKAREMGVLLNNTSDHVLRMVPPLVVTESEIDRVVSVLGKVL
jgi:acetylornithine/N-succinyldiaminopimelate aminotransferase